MEKGNKVKLSANDQKFRGHDIYFDGNEHRFKESDDCVRETWQAAGCGHCKKRDTPEGHDACLGTLNTGIVMNACCGHGKPSDAYVQFWDGSSIRGDQAILEIDQIKNSAK